MRKHLSALALISRCARKGLECPPNAILGRHKVHTLIQQGYIRVTLFPGPRRQIEILRGRTAGWKTARPDGEPVWIVDREGMRRPPNHATHAPVPYPHHCAILGGWDDAEIARNMKRGVRHDEVVSAL